MFPQGAPCRGVPHRLGPLGRGPQRSLPQRHEPCVFAGFQNSHSQYCLWEATYMSRSPKRSAWLPAPHWGNVESCKTRVPPRLLLMLLDTFSNSGKVPKTHAKVRNLVLFCRNNVQSCQKDILTISVFMLNNLCVSRGIRIFLQNQILSFHQLFSQTLVPSSQISPVSNTITYDVSSFLNERHMKQYLLACL